MEESKEISFDYSGRDNFVKLTNINLYAPILFLNHLLEDWKFEDKEKKKLFVMNFNVLPYEKSENYTNAIEYRQIVMMRKTSNKFCSLDLNFYKSKEFTTKKIGEKIQENFTHYLKSVGNFDFLDFYN